ATIRGLILSGENWRRTWGQTAITIVLNAGLGLTVDADVFTQVNAAGNRQIYIADRTPSPRGDCRRWRSIGNTAWQAQRTEKRLTEYLLDLRARPKGSGGALAPPGRVHQNRPRSTARRGQRDCGELASSQ